MYSRSYQTDSMFSSQYIRNTTIIKHFLLCAHFCIFQENPKIRKDKIFVTRAIICVNKYSIVGFVHGYAKYECVCLGVPPFCLQFSAQKPSVSLCDILFSKRKKPSFYLFPFYFATFSPFLLFDCDYPRTYQLHHGRNNAILCTK